MSLFLTIDVSKVDEKYVMSIYDAHDDIWEQVEVSGPLTFFFSRSQVSTKKPSFFLCRGR